jgi:DNA-binding CsgD family transcriptional regulator
MVNASLGSIEDFHPNSIVEARERRPVLADEGGLVRHQHTEIGLRQALAAMVARLRQKEELIRQLLSERFADGVNATKRVAGLTARQRQIMDLVLAGHPSKNIAADLGISQRTVENHRAAIMKRTGAKSLPALARLALVADLTGDAEEATRT